MRHSRREVVRLIQQIQELTLDLKDVRHRGCSDRELRAKQRTLERFRWRLAAAARRAAVDELGAAV